LFLMTAPRLRADTAMPKVKYNTLRPGEKRKHYIDGRDVDVVLSRLPTELWSRLRAVHFNDRGRGCRCLGYVNRGHREIALCALPPRVSLTRFLVRGTLSSRVLKQTPAEFGAARGCQWPSLAVRRFMLYDVFLHELGHLQIVNPRANRLRRRFASETKAQEFANYWRGRLWSQPFHHEDPVHNPPSTLELAQLAKAHNCDLFRQSSRDPNASMTTSIAVEGSGITSIVYVMSSK
jgi:hypothetical protein